MNEVHNLLIGYELNKCGSQIAYYDRETGEPVSVPAKVGTGMYRFPATLCKMEGRDVWHFGIEADYFAAQRGGIPVENFFDCLSTEDPIQIDGQPRYPYELLAVYLKESLALLGVNDVVRAISCLTITTEKLDGALSSNIKKACLEIGLSSDKLILQDAMQSFYSYAYSQKNEMKARDIALFVFDGNQVSMNALAMDKTTRPPLVRPESHQGITLPETGAERDEAFYRYAVSLLDKRMISAVYLAGEGFDMKWAVKTVPYLCRGGRRVFQGQNLFVRGACYAALDKMESHHLRDQFYLGNDLVLTNVGMEMLVRGTMAYVPLISAGVNYFDSDQYLEMILEEAKDLAFVINSMDGRTRKQFRMELPGLPERPAGATRLGLTARCIDPKTCEIQVTDMGFGGFYEASGLTWTDTLTL